VYRTIVRRRTAEMFGRLSRGEWESVVAALDADVLHTFPGEHPLGGSRNGREDVLRWFERLGRLFPGHSFEVHRVLVRGGPWSTWVAVQWSAELRPAAGEPYENHGTHWIQLRWGRVKSFHGYLDTQRIAAACEEMAAAGIAEAAAAPIGNA
jgi:ketosteroid isomerase-like protein